MYLTFLYSKQDLAISLKNMTNSVGESFQLNQESFNSMLSTISSNSSKSLSKKNYSESCSTEEWLKDYKLEKYLSYFRDTLQLFSVEDLKPFKIYSLQDLEEKIWPNYKEAVSAAHRKMIHDRLSELS